MAEYKKSKLDNIERTAKFLDRMLAKGVIDEGGDIRKAKIDDINRYVMSSGFDSITDFTNKLGLKHPEVNQVFNELTFTAGAHLKAAKDALLDGTDDDMRTSFNRHLRNRKLGLQLHEIEKPEEAGKAQLAGMVATLPLGMRAETMLSKAATKLKPWVSKGGIPTTVVAGGEGALYETPEVVESLTQDDGQALEKLYGLIYAGGGNALFGLLGYAGMSALSGGKSFIRNIFGGGSKAKAEGMFTDAVLKDSSVLRTDAAGQPLKYQTMDDAITELEERRRISPESKPVAADLGHDTRLTASAIIEGMDDDVRDPALNFLEARQKGIRSDEDLLRKGGQADRISTAVEQQTGIPEKNILMDTEELINIKQTQAQDGYNQAYNTGSPVTQTTEDGQALFKLMRTPEGKAAYVKGWNIARKHKMLDDRAPTLRNPKVVFAKGNPYYTIAELDYAQRGYRDVQNIQKRATDQTGMGPEELSQDVQLVKKFQEHLGNLSPKWKEVFQKYATDSRAHRAQEEGYKFFNKSPKKVEFDMSKLSDGEKEFYKIGAANAVYDYLGQAKLGTNIAGMIDDQPKMAENIKVLFGTEESFKDFVRKIIVENEANKTGQFVKNSQTPRILAKQEDLKKGSGGLGQTVSTLATASYSPVWAGRELTKDIASRNPLVRAGGGRTSTKLGQMLLEPDPAKQALMMRAAERGARRRPVIRKGWRKGAGLLGARAAEARRREMEKPYEKGGLLFN